MRNRYSTRKGMSTVIRNVKSRQELLPGQGIAVGTAESVKRTALLTENYKGSGGAGRPEERHKSSTVNGDTLQRGGRKPDFPRPSKVSVVIRTDARIKRQNWLTKWHG